MNDATPTRRMRRVRRRLGPSDGRIAVALGVGVALGLALFTGLQLRELVALRLTDTVSAAEMSRSLRYLVTLSVLAGVGVLGLTIALARLSRMVTRLENAQRQVDAERRARAKVRQELRAADRLASVGKVASSLAHELGTPINVIAGRAELILMSPADEVATLESAERILQQALRMRDIIESVLGYARDRVRSGAITASRIGDVVTSAIDLLGPDADERGVELVRDGVRDMRGWFDGGRMLQVLTNVGLNAVQASRSGSRVVFRWTSAPSERARQAGLDVPAALVVEVVDTGCGMDAAQVARMSEPFYTTKAEGTGLGMAISTEIVRSLGGVLEVESAVGQGTTVRIFLPMSAPPVTTFSGPVSTGDSALPRQTEQ